jgi:hypothetical protein
MIQRRWIRKKGLPMGKTYIKNGTPVGTESLCRTCSFGIAFTGYRESERITMCTRVHPNIVLPFTVNTCNGYYDKNRPSYQQMQKLAIDVTPAPLKPVGFKVGPPEPLKIRTHINVDVDEDEDEDDD